MMKLWTIVNIVEDQGEMMNCKIVNSIGDQSENDETGRL